MCRDAVSSEAERKGVSVTQLQPVLEWAMQGWGYRAPVPSARMWLALLCLAPMPPFQWCCCFWAFCVRYQLSRRDAAGSRVDCVMG